MINHNTTIRINRTDWLIKQAQFLVDYGVKNKIASFLIYACLEARLALEKTDLDVVLACISDEDRIEIIELAKSKNGIEKQGKKIGQLKEKYQTFIVNVFISSNIKTTYYDFKKSKSIQNELSSFIHSYWLLNDEITTDSIELAPIQNLIMKTADFLSESLYVEGEGYQITGVQLSNLPEQDKIVLNEWKNNPKMTEDELLKRLNENRNKKE